MKNLSRAKRFDKAMESMPDRSEIECLRDELQNWLDSIPENLQSGTKAQTLEESINKLESIIDALDEIDSNSDIEFPSMFG